MRIIARVGIVTVVATAPGCSECFDHRKREQAFRAGEARAEQDNQRDYDRAYEEALSLTFEDGFDAGHAAAYDVGHLEGYYFGYQEGYGVLCPSTVTPFAAPAAWLDPEDDPVLEEDDDFRTLRTDDHREGIEMCAAKGYDGMRNDEAVAEGREAGIYDNPEYRAGHIAGDWAGFDVGMSNGWDDGYTDGYEAAAASAQCAA